MSLTWISNRNVLLIFRAPTMLQSLLTHPPYDWCDEEGLTTYELIEHLLEVARTAMRSTVHGW